VIELAPYVVVAPHLMTPGQLVESDPVRRVKPVDLAEVLASKIPEVALSRRGPLAGDLVLRGLSRDNVLITVDGTKTYCACPNRMDPPAFHVSSQQIEAVSIRKGPFYVEQGATVGGAVLVRTTDASGSNSLDAYAFYGDFNYFAGGLRAGGSLGIENLATSAGVYYQEGDVYEDGEGQLFTRLPGTNFRPEYQDVQSFALSSADFKGTWQFPEGRVLSLNYGYQDAVDVLYPGLKMDALVDTMHRGSIGLRQPVEGGWADELNYSFAFSTVDHDMQDRFRMSSQMNPAFAGRGYMMRTTAETAYYGLNIHASRASSDTSLRYGMSATDRYWDANNVIMMNQNDMLPDVLARTFGIWGVYERRQDAWAWEVGGRLDLSSSEARDSIEFIQELHGTETNETEDLLPSAYALIERDLGDGWRLYAGLGHASRVPDPQERYINLDRPGPNPEWIGNPDLDPVRNTELQAGVNRESGALRWSASIFHAWLTDYSYLEALKGDFGKATTYTGIDARLYGLSGDFTWQASEEFSIEGGLAWQEGYKHSYPASSSSDVLGEIPPLRCRMAVDWQKDKWSLHLESIYQDDLERIDPDLQEIPLEGWILYNLSGAWLLNEWLTLSGGIDNLFDQHYAVANGYVRDPFRSGVTVYEQGRFVYGRVTCSW